MPDSSARLDLPFIMPSQAQKHVTHNEAIERLDLLVQLTVAAFDATSPPTEPAEGQVWALGAAPGGVWAGHAETLAAFVQGGWVFISPRPGWRAVAGAELRIWSGSAWVAPTVELQNVAGVGINASSDATNRLAVAAAATLLSHDGAGHQLKINKATPGDTASLLFQTGFSGRAEMGTAGDDDFAIKVSADGADWHDALIVDAASGAVDMPNGAKVAGSEVYRRDNTLGTVSQSGGIPTGAIIQRGSNANGEFVRYADGTQICWTTIDAGNSAATGDGTFSSPYRSANFTWNFPASFVGAPVVAGAVSGDDNGIIRTHVFSLRFVTSTQISQARVVRIGSNDINFPVIAHIVAHGRWF